MQPEKRRTEGAGEAEGAGEYRLGDFRPLFLVAANIPNAKPSRDLPATIPAAGRTNLANPSRERRSRWSAMTVFTIRATSGTGRDWAISARVASNAVP